MNTYRKVMKSHWSCYRKLSSSSKKLVLGIETSCDDTGAAIVDQSGNILGEGLHSQLRTHISLGGIIPPIARDLHKEKIDSVVSAALNGAGVSLQELDAVAVAVEPGLVIALRVGLEKAKELCRLARKPLIPVHHMKAHALTVRLHERVEFPYLVLLASGGHCLLAVCHDVERFSLIGSALDDAPGEILDKIARRLKLKNLPQFADACGGRAIETLAVGGDPRKYVVHTTMAHRPDCNFSFAGIKSHFMRVIATAEVEQVVKGDGLVNNLSDICASVQYSIAHHLSRRVQRALLYCSMQEILPKCTTMVLSGGVASNMFIRRCLETVCAKYDCRLLCPPPKLCTDNGVMIAWAGMEKLMIPTDDITHDLDMVDVRGRSALGDDISEDVLQRHLKLERIKLL